MKRLYVLQINTVLRLFGRPEITLRTVTRWTERTLGNVARRLQSARTRREFEAICDQYGI